MIDILLGAVVLAMLGAAVAYIVKARKRGVKCIGCPDGCSCGHSCASGCGCNCGYNESSIRSEIKEK